MMRWPSSYRAHEGHVAPARARSQLWRLVIGLMIGAIVWYTASIMIFSGLLPYLPPEQATAGQPLPTLIALFSFVAMSLGVFTAVYVMHDRDAGSVIGPPQPVADSLWKVLGVLLPLIAIIAFVPQTIGGEMELSSNLAFRKWIVLLPVSLLAVFVQISAEEILFRGYLQQQLAARFASPWIWMGLPSILFGMAHYVPDQTGSNAGAIALWAGLFGLAVADLTARAGHLGPAIAVHLANNVVALLLVAIPGELSGLALFQLPFEMSNEAAVRAWLPVEFATILLLWLGARLAIRR